MRSLPAVVSALSITLTVVSAPRSRAAIARLTSLTGNDVIDWSAIPVKGTVVHATVTSEGGITGTAFNEKLDPFTRYDGFSGPELWQFSPGPIWVTFSSPVSSVGMPITIGGGPAQTQMIADIDAYDTQGNHLGGFTFTGPIAKKFGDTPLFIGLTDTTADIGKVSVRAAIDGGTQAVVAIGNVQLVNPALGGNGGSVPLPAAASPLMWLPFIGALWFVVRRGHRGDERAIMASGG